MDARGQAYTAAPEPRPLNSADWVMHDLHKRIMEGELPVGTRLDSVVDLAVRYKVGRSTIREALSSLKAMGLLDIRQGSGTYVKEASQAPTHPAERHAGTWMERAQSLRHMLEVRLVLETGNARLAARNREADDLARLEGLLREMEQALGDEATSEQADIRLHEAIAAATHNPALAVFQASLAQQLHEHMKDMRALWFYAERSSAERLLREHRLICEAIIAGDEARASNLMELHIAKVAEVLFKKQLQ